MDLCGSYNATQPQSSTILTSETDPDTTLENPRPLLCYITD